jgi:hypothetical protein
MGSAGVLATWSSERMAMGIGSSRTEAALTPVGNHGASAPLQGDSSPRLAVVSKTSLNGENHAGEKLADPDGANTQAGCRAKRQCAQQERKERSGCTRPDGDKTRACSANVIH